VLHYQPPYWRLRDYGVPGQLGLESTFEEYVARLVEIFREVRRVLKDDGTLWLNLGDSYAGSNMTGGTKSINGRGKKLLTMFRCGNLRGVSNRDGLGKVPGLKPKDLVGIPWRVAFALQADGWYLRSDIIWHKPNPMPESVTDRPTKAHEYLFLLAKSERYVCGEPQYALLRNRAESVL
jgi:DNA modification methylase